MNDSDEVTKEAEQVSEGVPEETVETSEAVTEEQGDADALEPVAPALTDGAESISREETDEQITADEPTASSNGEEEDARSEPPDLVVEECSATRGVVMGVPQPECSSKSLTRQALFDSPPNDSGAPESSANPPSADLSSAHSEGPDAADTEKPPSFSIPASRHPGRRLFSSEEKVSPEPEPETRQTVSPPLHEFQIEGHGGRTDKGRSQFRRSPSRRGFMGLRETLEESYAVRIAHLEEELQEVKMRRALLEEDRRHLVEKFGSCTETKKKASKKKSRNTFIVPQLYKGIPLLDRPVTSEECSANKKSKVMRYRGGVEKEDPAAVLGGFLASDVSRVYTFATEQRFFPVMRYGDHLFLDCSLAHGNGKTSNKKFSTPGPGSYNPLYSKLSH